MWLVAQSGLLYGSQRLATFVIGVAFAPALGIRGWGFWSSPFSHTWIGPRHTNYPDGSICAFEPSDGTWKFGDSLVSLLDLYSLWATRHLHLERLGRWPGRQAAVDPYERLSEIRDDEFCGCERGDALYSECCKDSDSKRRSEGVDFVRRTGLRKPPKQILAFLLDRDVPAPLSLVSPGGSRAAALARSFRRSTAANMLRAGTPISSQ